MVGGNVNPVGKHGQIQGLPPPNFKLFVLAKQRKLLVNLGQKCLLLRILIKNTGKLNLRYRAVWRVLEVWTHHDMLMVLTEELSFFWTFSHISTNKFTTL